jgi:Tfp pilus assembly protein PilF
MPPRRSRSGLVAGGVVVALAAVGTGGFLLGNRDGSPRSAGPTTLASAPTNVKPVATSIASSPVPTEGTVDELLTAALAFHVKGQLAEATTVYQAILKKDPNHLLAHYNLGQIAQTGGDNAAALAQYDQALATNADYAPAIYNAAIAYEAVGDPTKAIEFYRRALTRDPNSAPAMFRLGSLLVAQGHPEEGQPLVNRALVIDPALATVHK